MTRIKRLICRVFGHKFVPVYVPEDGKRRYLGLRCARCGERVEE